MSDLALTRHPPSCVAGYGYNYIFTRNGEYPFLAEDDNADHHESRGDSQSGWARGSQG